MRLCNRIPRLGQSLSLAGLALALTPAVSASPTPVVWIPAIGASVAASSLSSLGGNVLGEVAVGKQAFTSGAGFLEFGTNETNRAKAAGLGSRDGNRGLEAIDFGFLLRDDGTIGVVEKGAVVQSAGSYSVGDRFRVAVEGSAIVFRINGSLVRTSSLAFSHPLFAEATLAEAGATIEGAEIEGATAEAVEWAGDTKASTSAGFVSKSTGATAWDSSAFSTTAVAASDGYLEVSGSITPTVAMIGLSHGNTNSGYSDIDYALYMSSGTLYIYEGGVNRGSFGTFTASDRFRVSVESGVVKYRKNGALVYTSGVTPTFPLLVDSSLYASGSRFTGVLLSGALVQVAVSKPTLSVGSGLYPADQTVTVMGEVGSVIHYTTNGSEPTQSDATIASGSTLQIATATTLKAKAFQSGLYPSGTATAWYVLGVPAAEDVEWTAHVNANSTASTLSKTTAVVAWDSSAISTKGLASPDGYLEVPATLSGNVAMIGLSHGNANSGYSDIDYAVYFSSGTLLIYEGGINRGSFGTLAASDKVRVSVEGGVVRYRKNGTLLFTSTLAPVYPLQVDTSLYSSGASLAGAVLSGTLVSAAVPNPSFSHPSDVYAAPIDVVVTGAPGSALHYTTNGLVPTESDPVIASGSSLTLGVTTTLKARAFVGGLISSGTTTAIYQFGATSTEDVMWTGLVNASSSGNALTKTTNNVAWDASAISTKAIISPGGYLEVSAAMSPNVAMVGLSNGNTNSGYSDIDFALYLSGGNLLIYEAGLSRGSFGAYVATDKFRVSVESGMVKYRKNGNLIYTSALAPSYPLLVDASLYSAAATFSGAVISGSLVQVAVSRPVFSPGSGLYAGPQEVFVTGEPGSAIHYSTDGAEPTEADDVIESGTSLMIEADTTLKAKAWTSGLYPSSTTSAIYKFGASTTENVAWTAHVNATSTGNTLAKSVSTTAWDASGVSTTAIDSPDGYLEVSATLSPKVQMVGLSYGNTNSGYSDIDYALYLSSGTLLIYEGGLNRGSFGTIAGADKFRVSLEGGVVKYRKNGTLLYTSALAPRYPLLVDTALYSTTAVVNGAVLSGLLVNSRTPAPSASPEAGGYGLPIDVALSADPGATIRYTTDGTDPTATSPLYSAPITITVATTIKARAFRTGYLDSDVSTHAYTYAPPAAAPVFTPIGGSYLGPLLVTATTTTPGGLIHYSLNGDTPDASSPYVSSGATIAILYSTTLKAVTTSVGYSTSPVTSATYELVATEPTISPSGGSFSGPVEVTLSTTSGGDIRYTLDGSTPDAGSPVYAGPFTLSSSATVKATAFVAGWTQSSISSATFTVSTEPPATPTFAPPAGFYSSTQSVTLTSSVGATIHYTIDGSEPTMVSPAYTAPIEVAAPTTIKARAFGPGNAPSEISTGRYDVVPFNHRLWVGSGEETTNVVLLNSQGQAWAWGDNTTGQLGLETGVAATPFRVPIFDEARDLSSSRHTVWLDGNGALLALGANDWGQATGVPGPQVTTPTAVAGLPPLRKVSADSATTLALAQDGTVWVWGNNEFGQHGLGHQDEALAPSQVPGLADIIDIQSYSVGFMALRADGVLFSWGLDDEGGASVSPVEIGSLPGIRSLNQGLGVRAAVDFQGRIWTWGYSNWSQSQIPSLIPASVECSGGVATPIGELTGVKEVRGYFVWFEDGSIRYLYNQYCDDDGLFETTRAIPTTNGAVTATASQFGNTYVMATDQGEVWTWGYDSLGDGTLPGEGRPNDPLVIAATSYLFPARAPEFTPDSSEGPFAAPLQVTATSITPGAQIHYTIDGDSPTAASPSITNGGTISMPVGGTLRAITVAPDYAPSAVIAATYDVPAPTPVSVATTDGVAFTVLKKPNGTVWTWGWTGMDGISVDYRVPVPARIPGLSGVKSVAAGQQQALAVKNDGTLVGWGDDGWYQIAGTGGALTVPTAVPGLPPVVGTATGRNHSLALAQDGTVWSWGWNFFGELGVDPGTSSNPTAPAQVEGVTDVVAVAAGYAHSLALKADQTVWVWGSNTLSAPGAPWIPTQVTGLSGIVKIIAYQFSSIAIDAGGRAWIWGLTPWGESSDSPMELAESRTCEPNEEGGDRICSYSAFIESVADVQNGLVRFTDGTTRRYLQYVSGDGGESVSLSEPVTGPTDAVAISGTGLDYGVVVTASGSVWTWGDGAVSGDGGNGHRPDPGDIALDNFTWRTGMPRRAWDEPFAEDTLISLSSVTPEADIHYTLDGTSASESSTSFEEPFTAPFQATLRAVAMAPGKPASLPLGLTLPAGTLGDIQFSPDGGVFTEAVRVTVSNPTPGVSLHYRLDGIEPTEADPVMASGESILVETSLLLSVSAFKDGYTPVSATASYDITAPVPLPRVDPPSGPVLSELVLTDVGQIPGTVVRYSFGMDPVTQTSPELPLTLSWSLTASTTFSITVRTFNRLTGAASEPMTLMYTIHLARPVVSPVFQTPGGPKITVSPANPLDEVHVTVNGLDPTESDPLVEPGAEVLATGLVKLRSFRPFLRVVPSPVVTLDFRDGDGDALTDAEEAILGTDPNDADTNHDGLPDGNAVAAGLSATSADMDGDGVLNAQELSKSTNPFDADTDHDGFGDAIDVYPLDPTRHALGSPPTGDTTPPTITLLRPRSAVLVGGN